jgi:hypothetical protein
MPTQEIIRLTLKAFDFPEYLPTKTTDKPEANAESSAKVDPIMAFLEGDGCIKTNLFVCAFRMDAVDALCSFKLWVNAYLRAG